MAQIPQMRSIGLLDDLSPEQQAQRQQDVYMGLLQAPAYGAMMMPLSGIYETTGQMPDPANPSQKLPSTAELIRRGDFEGLGYQGLGVLGDVMYAVSPVAPFLAPMAAGLKGTAATSRGIRAYHGSPYSFDQFRTSQIGTGEGNQAFGHGLYFADAEKTAKSYRDEGVFQKAQEGSSPIYYKGKPFEFLDDVPEAEDENYQAVKSIVDIMRRRGVSAEEAKKLKVESLERDVNRYTTAGTDESDVGFIDLGDGQSLENLLASSSQSLLDKVRSIDPSDIDKPKGSMYEVNIDASLDELVDYDKTLGQQSPEVKKFFEDAADELNVDDAINLGFDPFEMKGDDIEKKAIELAKKRLLDPDGSVGSFLGTMASLRGSADAGEELLMSKGAKGIKYFDGDSRNTAGAELIGITKEEDGYRAKIAVDNRAGAFADRGRIVTTSPPYKTEKEAKEWAEEASARSSRNYVIFDENLIDIMRKYGLLAPMVGGAGAYGLMQEPEQNKSGLLELEG